MSTSSFADNFLKALQDDRIKENPRDIFESSIKLLIDEQFAAVKRTVDGLSATVELLRNEIKNKDVSIAQLKAENDSLKNNLADIEKTNDELQQYCRKDNLVITGVPASFAEHASVSAESNGTRSVESSAETVHKVTELIRNELKCANISEADISTAHRLPSRNGTSPIIVRFLRRRDRDAVYRSRMELKAYNQSRAANNRVFINEDLSPRNREIFSAAWRMKGSRTLDGVWTSNCHVLVKKNGSTHRVTSLAQLRSL